MCQVSCNTIPQNLLIMSNHDKEYTAAGKCGWTKWKEWTMQKVKFELRWYGAARVTRQYLINQGKWNLMPYQWNEEKSDEMNWFIQVQCTITWWTMGHGCECLLRGGTTGGLCHTGRGAITLLAQNLNLIEILVWCFCSTAHRRARQCIT